MQELEHPLLGLQSGKAETSTSGSRGLAEAIGFACCLSQFLFLHKHHDQEASWGGKGLFSLHFHIAVDHQRKSGQELTQGRNLEAGADAEAMEGAAYWLAPHDLLSLLSNST